MTALPFPVVARPLPAAALYRRLRALAAELALLTAQAADRARNLEAANLETLAEIYVEDARYFGQLAGEADSAPRLAIIPPHPEEHRAAMRLEGPRPEQAAPAAPDGKRARSRSDQTSGSPPEGAAPRSGANSAEGLHRTLASLSPMTREDAAAGPGLSSPTARGPAAVCSDDGASGGDAA